MKKSAGILLYRFNKTIAEFFLVHPGGPFWARKEEGAWSIPKGEFEDGEEPLTAALREMQEETGINVTATLFALTPVKQKNNKLVMAWAGEQDAVAASIISNEFEMEWPPRSGKLEKFPEVDKAGWFTLEAALKKIIPAQQPLLIECSELIRSR